MIMHKLCHKNLKNEGGFTLVEVMVALGILSFGMLAVASMQSTSLLSTAKSNAVTLATSIATDRMERLLAQPFDSLSIMSGDNDHAYFSGAQPLPSNIESVNWSVEAFQANMKKVTVTVQYREMRTPVRLTNLKIKT